MPSEAAASNGLPQPVAADPEAGARLVEELRLRQRRIANLTNTIGALLVASFVIFLAPVSVDADARLRLTIITSVIGTIYLCSTLFAGVRWGLRITAPTYQWLQAGRPPDQDERDLALRTPLRLSVIGATFWTGAALLLGGVQLIESPKLASIVFDAMVLGGVTTCALAYLLTERVWRPVIAIALAGGSPEQPVLPGIRARLMMAWALATGVPLIGIFAVASAGVFGFESDPPELLPASMLFLAVVALFTGLLATRLVADSVADPLAAVRSALARVERGELDVEVTVDDGSEIGLVQAGFNRMATGLRERERLREVFGRHVGHDVARAALDGGFDVGGEVREVGVVFVDLVGSTSMALERSPTEVVSVLNSFFAIVVETVEQQGGWVNKFEGDAALCVFGAPATLPDPAGGALAAGRRLRDRLRSELPDVDAGIGVSAGAAVAGNVGAEQRYEYTVIGDPVNEAARLCELAKDHPERLLASGTALDDAEKAEASRWERGEEVVLRGRGQPTRLATISSAASVSTAAR